MSRKRIKELERTLKEKDIEIDNLKREAATLKLTNEELVEKFEEMSVVKNSIPEDCTSGKYCEACAFSKRYYLRSGFGWTEVVLCNKAGGCKNFVQEEKQ